MPLLLLVFVLFQVLTPNQTGVINGKIISIDGTPAKGVRVSAVPAPAPGEPAVSLSVIVGSSRTGTDGTFRLENISPGQYTIAAGALTLPTWYPGTVTVGEARTISVAAGSIVNGVNFAMRQAVGVDVRGRLSVAPSLQPTTTLQARLVSPFGEILETPVRPDGTFLFSQVPPGDYSANVIGSGARGRISAPVNVNADVAEVRIDWPFQMEVAATLSVEDGSDPPILSPAISAGCTFQRTTTCTTWMGVGEQRISATFVPSGYFVRSISVDGTDLLKQPLRIFAGQPAATIHVVLGITPPDSVHGVRVSGRITGLPDGLLDGVRIVMAGREAGGGPVLETRSVRGGTFEFTNVIPGTYSVRIERTGFMLENKTPSPGLPVTTVVVSNQDLSGLEFGPPASVNVVGRATVVDAHGRELSRTLNGVNIQFTGVGSMTSTEVGFDGTFLAGLRTGSYSLSFTGMPAAYSVKSMKSGSLDLMTTPLTIEPNDKQIDVRITLESMP